MPNRLGKNVAFILNKNLFFIGNMQFMNSSLENTNKNLSDYGFKYLTQRIWFKTIRALKKKILFLMNTWTVLKNFQKRNI